MIVERRERLVYRDLVVDGPHDFKVHTSVYSDPQVFDDEMRNIFEKTWVYVAHESEIEHPGDYRTAAIGRIPVIVSRGADSQVYVMLNVCRHRGTTVCQEERGNSQYFRCPYHSWVYRNDGTLVGIADRKGYPDDWGREIEGLVKAPRVSIYRGMIFASFSSEGDSLEDYFGPLKKYIDYWFEHSPAGRVRLRRPYKAIYPGNWKLQLENSTDGWHARYVHESALKTLEHFGVRNNAAVGWPGCTRAITGGHGVLEVVRNDIPPEVESEFNEHQELLRAHYGAEQAEEIYYRRHITIFPNFHLMEYKFRIVQPVSVDKTIVYEYPVEFEDVPENINRAVFRRTSKEISVSSGSLVSGVVNSDDVEIFARAQSGLQATPLDWLYLSRGLTQEPRPLTREMVGDRTDEGTQRSIHREWARLMGSGNGREAR